MHRPELDTRMNFILFAFWLLLFTTTMLKPGSSPERLQLIHAPSICTSSSNDFFQCSLSCICLHWTLSGILLFSHPGFISSLWNPLLCSLFYINFNIFVLSANFSALLFIPFPRSLNMSGEQIVEEIIHEYSFEVKSKFHFDSLRDHFFFTFCKQSSTQDLLVQIHAKNSH